MKNSKFLLTTLAATTLACATPAPSSTDPKSASPPAEPPTLAVVAERQAFEDALVDYLQILTPGEAALTEESQSTYMDEKGPGLWQLNADAEKRFTASKGDREVFGWHLYRKTQATLSFFASSRLQFTPTVSRKRRKSRCARATARPCFRESSVMSINLNPSSPKPLPPGANIFKTRFN